MANSTGSSKALVGARTSLRSTKALAAAKTAPSKTAVKVPAVKTLAAKTPAAKTPAAKNPAAKTPMASPTAHPTTPAPIGILSAGRKSIQENFGQAVMDAITAFARTDAGTPTSYEANEFSWVSDAQLKTALAETLYGARWIYKLGLAILADGVEQYAHVRAQIIDYGSVSEAFLANVILQAKQKGLLVGPTKDLRYPGKTTPLTWHPTIPKKTVDKTSFEWRIVVAQESGIIDAATATALHIIRNHRNTVHLTAKVASNTTYLASMATKARNAMNKANQQCKAWVAAHP